MCIFRMPGPIGGAMLATIAQERERAFQNAYVEAVLRPGCIEVVILRDYGPMPFAVVWGKPTVPRVPRRRRDH